MPVVEKVAGPRVSIRRVGEEFSVGDRADVGEATAAYLCEERGDFEVVEATDVEYDEVDDAEDDSTHDADICGAELSDGGTCERPADECPYHGDDEE